MKKIFMFAVVFGLLLGTVSAVDLQEHDFDGHFTLDVPGNAFYVDASADDYECPTVVTDKSHGSCGQSRFGQPAS